MYAVLAFIVTVVAGLGGAILGSRCNFPELSCIISIAVMGVFVICTIKAKNE